LGDIAGTRGLVEERAMAVAYRLGAKRAMLACTTRLAQLAAQWLMLPPPHAQPAVASSTHHAACRTGGGDAQSLVVEVEVEGEQAMQWRRKLRVTASVRQGQTLGSAPAAALLNAAAAHADEALGPTLAALDVAADIALAVLLLKETATATAHDAPWAAYVRRLRRLQPPAVRLVQCASLTGTTAADAAQAEAEELRDRAERELLPVVQACGAAVMGGDVSVEQMCWALKVVDELAVEMPPSPGALM
jgi:peptidoglycan/LPS O-acetylase OafA/YrhL